MKPRTSFLKRGLSLVLALLMVLSNANLGIVLQANAAESSVKAGELMANTYALTDAEKAILKSGYLAGDTAYTYDPAVVEGKVTVDADAKTITAASVDGWKAVSAKLVNGETEIETVALTDGVGTYTHDGNAFSVKVTYALYLDVNTDAQNAMLSAISALKQGVAYVDAVAAESGALSTMELAMPELVEIATNGYKLFGTTVNFAPEVVTAVNALNAQMSSGHLTLVNMLDAYAAGKTNYLLNNGTALKAELESTTANIKTINGALTTIKGFVDSLGEGSVDGTSLNLVKMLNNILNNWDAAVAPIIAAEWTAANRGTALVSETVDYAALDTMVAALTTISPVTTTSPLKAAETVVQVNMDMINVDVTVKLNMVENVVDSMNLVEHDAVISKAMTLNKGLTPAEVRAAAQAIVDEAIAAWGAAYADGHFNVEYSELPESLTEDAVLVITYSPKTYTVSTNWSEAMTVPYGYQMTLPNHATEGLSYDYTVNGAAYTQGSVYKVVGNTTVSREEGKAYTNTTLYTIVADNFGGNDLAKSILKSGALKNDVNVSVRKPDPEDADALLTLKDGTLTAAATYPSDYQGLMWVPYTYGANGDENKFSGNTASWSEDEVNAMYVLNLTNFTVERVDEILDTVVALKTEAENQKSVLDAFASYYDTMGQLDKTKLGALNGVIDVTDFTPGDNNENDEKNLELRAYFKSQVGGIIANNLDSNNKLKIYNILGQYNAGGLRYYYINSAAVLNEINSLADRLAAMLADEEKVAALEIMVGAAGYPEYADKIADLNGAMATVQSGLTAPNAAINLNSDKLTALVNLLSSEGTVEVKAADTPYLVSEPLTQWDSSDVPTPPTTPSEPVDPDEPSAPTEPPVVPVTFRLVTNVEAKGSTKSKTWPVQGTNGVAPLTQERIDEIAAWRSEMAAELLGENVAYYTYSVVDGDNNAVGELTVGNITSNMTRKYIYTAKTFAVSVAGENQTVSIENPTITLPAHETQGMAYIYIVDGETIEVRGIDGVYELSPAQLARLNGGESFVVSRTEVNEADEMLADMLEVFVQSAPAGDSYIVTNGAGDPVIYMENGALVNNSVQGDLGQLIVNVSASKNGLMSFAMGMFNSGYSNIELNGEPLLYTNSENTLEVSLQALINAILADKGFNRDRVIALGETGKGSLLTADMTFGDGSASRTLDLIMNLNSVPSQMATVAKGLKAVKSYVDFCSTGDSMLFTLNLPEKVYEAYLTALLGTGMADKNDITAINNEIAYMFLWDYIDEIVKSDADADSFENTINKALGIVGSDKTVDLTDYNEYYMMVKKVLTNEGFSASAQNGNFRVDLRAKGKSAIDAVLNVAGFDASSLMVGEVEAVSMIKEYKDGGELYGAVEATLGNTGIPFEALVLEPNNIKESKGSTKATLMHKANAFDYTTDLPARVAQMNGAAAVVLLGNVDGDLNFPGTTVLDLNGYRVNGSVSAGGKLMILDSRLETATDGTVTGSVSGNGVIVIGGNFPGCDVTSYLKPGYIVENGYVRNALYTIKSNDGKNVNVVLDSNVIDADISGYTPFVQTMAVDLAFDLAMNYYTAAALNYNGQAMYAVNFTEILALLDGSDRIDHVIEKIVGFVGEPGITSFANAVLADLLNFEELNAELNTAEKTIGTYAMSTYPWTIDVEYIADEDYIDFGIVPNANLPKNFNVSVSVGGDRLDLLKLIIAEMAETTTATATVTLNESTYDGSSNTVSISGNGQFESFSDLTMKPYDTVIGVILAYGGCAEKDNIVAALEARDDVALKAAVDNTTVKEVFDALKKLSRNVSFAEMVASLGMEERTQAAELEEIFHLVLCASGKALEVLEITGMNAKLGALDEDGDRIYVLEREVKRSGDVGARGYFVDYDVEFVKVKISVKLFDNSQGWDLPEYLEIEGVPVVNADMGTEILDTLHDTTDPVTGYRYGDYILATSYEIAESASEKIDDENIHDSFYLYPNTMSVWELIWDEEAGEYQPVEVTELHDIMKYMGTSIRLNHKDGNAIRFITELTEDDRDALIAGDTLAQHERLAGYKLIEVGTLFRNATEAEFLSLATQGVQKSLVYNGKDTATGADSLTNFRWLHDDKTYNDPNQVSPTNNVNWFTGLIDGGLEDRDNLIKQIWTRPYMVLERADDAGNVETITIYGGSYIRSVFYVGVQNVPAYEKGTDFGDYIWNKIIYVVDPDWEYPATNP
ncbi:MAG: hypothetical protein IJB59_01060 [Oscillospiraceae bacterium]|nr:hypothetical protein [Oscillospiraceae bacterium]